MSETLVHPYDPRPHFEQFHARDQRWSVLVCHRRAGKTVAAINDLIAQALHTKKEHARYAYLAPLHSQAKSIAWDYLLRYTEGLRTYVNVSELTVELFNGSRIRLFGGDNPDSLRGIYLDGVILDEPAQMKPRLWTEILLPLLADRKGFAVFIGTPAGKNSFWKTLQSALLAPKDWFSLILRASESKIIDAEELERLKTQMDEDEFAQEFECSFEAAIRGAYFGKTINDMGERLADVPHDPSMPVHVAMDIGWRDDTTMWFWQTVGSEIRFIDCYSSSGLTVQDYVDILNAKPYNYGSVWLPHDAFAKTMQTGKSTFELFGSAGVRARRVPDLTVQQGILAARQLLTLCWIDKTACAEGLEALRQYQREFDARTGTFRANPRHDWTSHYADGFRYAAVVSRMSEADIFNRLRITDDPRSLDGGYDPSQPYGGTVKLNDMWEQVRRPQEERI